MCQCAAGSDSCDRFSSGGGRRSHCDDYGTDDLLHSGFVMPVPHRQLLSAALFEAENKKGLSAADFQVGIPAGIQSTVINFSNALLQSSVNSFGDTAMAGYTAANNILGFLYMSVNSITQACMSFTSQNYGVGKYKRMDRVLIDCLILTVSVPLLLGCGAWLFGPQVLSIYTREKDVIESGMEILAITTVPYFLCGIMDLFPGALRGMGHSAVPMILSVIGTVGTRILWIFGFSHITNRCTSCLFLIRHPGSSRL